MSTTRQQIIEKTSELFERQGYHATGLNQIVSESETPRGSLYYYFPEGKEELAAEAVWYKVHHMSAYIRQRLACHPDAIEAIYQLMVEMADHAEQQHCSAARRLRQSPWRRRAATNGCVRLAKRPTS